MYDRAPGLLLIAALAVLAGVLAFGVIARPCLASNDSYNYVDVARNAALGRGLSQSALGYNEPHFPVDGNWPAPFTSQSTLYPLAIAALIRLGIEPVRAGLLVPLLALVAIWAIAWQLACDLWNRETGAVAVGLLTVPVALPGSEGRAWSEPLALALALLALVFQIRAARRLQDGEKLALAAGIAAGAAFATRYIFALCWLVGLAGWAAHGRRGRAGSIAFTVGFAFVASPVLLRNWNLTGSLLGAGHNNSELSVGGVLGQMAGTLTSGPGGALLALAALGVVALLLVALRHRVGSWRAAVRLVPGAEGWLVALWAVTYIASLVVLRSLIYFDPIGLRLLGPSLAVVSLLAAALATHALVLPRRTWLTAAAAITLLVAGVVLMRYGRTEPPASALGIARSDHMSWIRDHVRPTDLLIADDAVDLALHLNGPDGGPRRVVSFSAIPDMQPLCEDDLVKLIDARACVPGADNAAWLILRRRASCDAEWRELFGPFVADLVAGRTAAYPRVTPAATLEDAYVFRIESNSAAITASPAKPLHMRP
ncbi:MAG: glycosyltransferase family 39 protein [Acidobacteria bacterium]|jgi:hypothetical protein|nr:glycosyltransferase family 39 protein [Acidobacteriota bacterium]